MGGSGVGSDESGGDGRAWWVRSSTTPDLGGEGCRTWVLTGVLGLARKTRSTEDG